MDELMYEARTQLRYARKLGLDIRYIDEHMGIGWLFNETEQRNFSEALRVWAMQEGLVWHESIPLKPLFCSSATELQIRLQTLTTGNYLLITHPAYDNEEMRQVGSRDNPLGVVARAREMDLRMLCDPGVRQIIRERNILLSRYDD
ncbi:hypothetical protein KDK_71780 [Dictyobacter kobayashii]|uniref:ChbG/HpnK family deacetylase n=2 Tax=Dictyobacter kobayashii TaxID=2014872 RepID=A0A402AWA5_9CHLR|nr:hypothetical protein KDK_71780 [Dictyobacter kobayashii]